MFWLEPRSSQNLLVGGKQRWVDLSGHGNHANAPSAGANPPTAAEPLLNGIIVAQMREAHAMVVSAVTRPRGIYAIWRPIAGGSAGNLATSYGVGFAPAIRNNAAHAWGYYTGNDHAAIDGGHDDDYYRVTMLVDGGSGPNAVHMDEYDTSWTSIIATLADTNATVRQADGLDFTINDPRFPTRIDLVAIVGLSSTPSAGLVGKLNNYFRPRLLDAALPPGAWVGTHSDIADAQPRKYPPLHDGVSGQTLQGFAWLLNGTTWSGTDVTLGSPSDPGPGARGAAETICITQGHQKVVPLLLGVPAVETQNDDATFIALFTDYERAIRRTWAIAQGGIERFIQLPILPGLVAPYDSTRGALFNAWVVSTLIPSLAVDGIPMSYCDLNIADFDTAVHLLAGGADQHLSEAGGFFCGAALATFLEALGLNTAEFKLWWIGHSHVSGALDKVPAATSQIRAPAARKLTEWAIARARALAVLGESISDYVWHQPDQYTLDGSERIDVGVDQTEHEHDIAQVAPLNRPRVGYFLGPTGRDVLDARLAAGVYPCGLKSADIGLANLPYWVALVAKFGGESGYPNAYILDGATAFSTILYPFDATTLGMYQGINAPQIGGMVAGRWYVMLAKFAGAASKLGVNAGTLVAANSGNNTTTGAEIGTGAALGAASDTLIERVVYLPGSLSDEDANAVALSLLVQMTPTFSFERLYCGGDSLVVGQNDEPGGVNDGGWRPTAQSALDASGRHVFFVGPVDNSGRHGGIGGGTIQSVAADPATFWDRVRVAGATKLSMAWGINDVFAGRSAVQIKADYATVLAAKPVSSPIASLDDITIEPICQPPNTTNYPPAVINAFNASIGSLGTKVGATISPTPTTTGGGVHFDPAGYVEVGTQRAAGWIAPGGMLT